MAKKPGPVQQAVQAQIQPYLGQLAAQRNQEVAAENQKRMAIQGATSQFLQYLSQNPSVAGDYNHAAQVIGQLADRSASLLAAANPNGQTQADLAAINAPQAQRDQVTGSNNAAFNGGASVLYGAGGMIPGSSLAEQGAAAAAYQRSLPGIVGLAGQQNLRQFNYDTSQSAAKYAADRANVLAKIPELTLAAQSAISDAQAKRDQIALERQAFGLKVQNQQFNQGLAAKKFQAEQDRFLANYQRQVDQFNARQQNADAKLSMPNPSLSRSLGYLVDSSGNPITKKNGDLVVLPGFKVRGGQIVKTGKGKSGGFTPYQIQKYRGTAETIAANAYSGFKDAKGNDHPPLDYGAALEEMRQEGIPVAIAVKALGRFYKYGERGRPYPRPTRDTGFRSANLP